MQRSSVGFLEVQDLGQLPITTTILRVKRSGRTHREGLDVALGVGGRKELR